MERERERERERETTDGSERRVTYRTTGTKQKISLNEEEEDCARRRGRRRRITSGARSGELRIRESGGDKTGCRKSGSGRGGEQRDRRGAFTRERAARWVNKRAKRRPRSRVPARAFTRVCARARACHRVPAVAAVSLRRVRLLLQQTRHEGARRRRDATRGTRDSEKGRRASVDDGLLRAGEETGEEFRNRGV